MKKVLITGITGFVGSHLAEYCLTKPDVKVYGTVFSASHRLETELENVRHIQDKIELLECNLMNRVSVQRVLGQIRPDVIFHLAAQSFVPLSWKSPEETLSTNIISQLNIFETVRELGINPVIQIAGSSEEYGLVYENEVPIKETNVLRPLSPYGVSKVGQDTLACQYYHSYKLKTVITRAFNHEGPRRGEQFVTATFAKQIVEVEKGKRESVIYVGNLDAKRDYSDVRDIVKAYWLATEKCTYGEPYNICSEKTMTIREMLDMLLKLSTVKDIRVQQDPARMRPSDVMVLLGDCSKFKEKTGWKPEIPLKKTLQDTLDYWREKI